MTLRGYGRMLDVDLASGKIEKKDIDAGFARKYLGGAGFGSKILYDEVGPGMSPAKPRKT